MKSNVDEFKKLRKKQLELEQDFSAQIEKITYKRDVEVTLWNTVVFNIIFGLFCGGLLLCALHAKNQHLSIEEFFISIAFAAIIPLVRIEYRNLSRRK